MVDAKAGVLLVRVPGVAEQVRIAHRSDCSINSGFDVESPRLVDTEDDGYDPSKYTEQYRSVLIAWTKSRHGVPNQPIKYQFTASNGDITLNKKALDQLRLSMKNQPVQFIARN